MVVIQYSLDQNKVQIILSLKVEKNKDSIYWKIGERVRQNPELLLNSGSESRYDVATGKYAYIAVR